MNGSQILLSYAGNNPGAVTFMMELLTPAYSSGDVAKIEKKLAECRTLRGTNLYVLWSDLADRDPKKVMELIEKCPSNILEEACDKQDYSGRELVAPYLS